MKINARNLNLELLPNRIEILTILFHFSKRKSSTLMRFLETAFSLGYNAETVSSGEEAIEHVKENPVDLIVLDMVMPKGINGRKTYEEIMKIRPGQKAIIATGYAKTKEVDKVPV